MDADLRLALRLADVADDVTTAWFGRSDLHYESKADGSPVSDGDRAAETALREMIALERPGDAVVGEEEGGASSGSRRWIIDPIDGTVNYVRGAALWGTLIALERDGDLVLGVVSAPALPARWWAARGSGAFLDGQPIRVSKVETLERATLLYASAESIERTGHGSRFAALARRCAAAHPGFGGFWPHVLTAQGSAELVAQAGSNLWDIAAPAVVVEEAGGRISGIGGSARLDDSLLLSSNGRLHAEALACMA